MRDPYCPSGVAIFTQSKDVLHKRTVINRETWEQFHVDFAEHLHPWNVDGAVDDDFDLYLASNRDASLLEIGIGSGYQLLKYAQNGFDISGSDIAPTSIKRVKERLSRNNLTPSLYVDDIRQSAINSTFDIVMDRGCFHSLHPYERAAYQDNVARLLNPNGFLLLKCFSDHETEGDFGPYRISRADIVNNFSDLFCLRHLRATHFDLRRIYINGKSPVAWLAVLDLK